MGMVYIFSTLTANQRYIDWEKGGADLPIQGKEITIVGGANLPNGQLITSLGARTIVTEEDYAILQRNEMFKLHVENGFIKVQKQDAPVEKVTVDMKRRDKSAPLTPVDFQNQGENEAKIRE